MLELLKDEKMEQPKPVKKPRARKKKAPPPLACPGQVLVRASGEGKKRRKEHCRAKKRKKAPAQTEAEVVCEGENTIRVKEHKRKGKIVKSHCRVKKAKKVVQDDGDTTEDEAGIPSAKQQNEEIKQIDFRNESDAVRDAGTGR